MFGAIIGDIAGSRFEGEGKDHRSKDFEMFNKQCRFTDDTIMTLALCKALLEYNNNLSELHKKAICYMQQFGKYYPGYGYAKGFKKWLASEDPKPYGSFGNGSAMRVSGCAYVGQTLDEVKLLSKTVTEVTHNDPEGLEGAEAVAIAVFLARTGQSRDEIKKYIDNNYYPMDFTIDKIRSTYRFSSRCKYSVPQALMAFFDSVNFEDSIRNAISIGGDSDTIAAIAGSVAEAYYGIPERLRQQAAKYLNHWLLEIIDQFEEKYPSEKIIIN